MKVSDLDLVFTTSAPISNRPRDMYICLYLKNNQPFKEAGPIPALPYNENWLKPNQIDFQELFVTIEYRAICKIRQHFFSWIENKLVGPAIKNAQLFTTVPAIAPAPQLIEPPNITMEELDDSPPTAIELCEEPDVTIQNPQIKLTCILCQQSGEKRVTGRLIPFQVN